MLIFDMFTQAIREKNWWRHLSEQFICIFESRICSDVISGSGAAIKLKMGAM